VINLFVLNLFHSHYIIFLKGTQFEQITSIFTALIIGQCIFFAAAFAIMMLGASRALPGGWIEYDVETYALGKVVVE
jgi:hypothetical protein